MLLKNCKIITSKEIIEADILIEDGKIAKLGKNLKGNEETINLKGKPVFPGLVDIHVHARDFKQSYKEDFASCTKAALANGITMVVDMPNTLPPVMDKKTFDKRVEIASLKSYVDFGINFGVADINKEEIENLLNAKGVKPFAFKIYMDDTLGKVSSETIERAIETYVCCVHAEEHGIIEAKGRVKEAEILAVKKICKLAERYRKHVHICHISYKESLRYLNRYVTCEVTPHHLLLTHKDFKELGSIAKVNPPLRTREDNKALLEALKNGMIQIIASDHAPHTLSEKESENPPAGIPNLDVMFKLLLTLVNKKILSLHNIVLALCENPCKIFGIKNKGIEVGKDADLIVLNLKKEGKIVPEEFYSKAKYSPFEGWKTIGEVETVIFRGKIAYVDGEIIKNKKSEKRF